MKSHKIILSLLLLGLVWTSCTNKADESNTSQGASKTLEGNINIDGSSTVYPITEAVAEEYRAVQPKVRVTVGVSGTGGGFKKFSRGETDISDASRPIKQKEQDACAQIGIKYVQLPVAYDGLSVLVHPENDWVDHFTVEELNRLWRPDAQGKITKWNQIRPEWPDKEIHLFGPGTASGTYDYFSEAICGKHVGTRGDYTASEDDNVLVQGIAGDKYALGFFGLAYYEENKDKLKLVAVDNGNGPVLPDMQTVSGGTYSPLSRPIFIYVSSKSVSKPQVVSFVNFYLEHAAKLSQEVGYIPLPVEEYKKDKDTFSAFVEANTK